MIFKSKLTSRKKIKKTKMNNIKFKSKLTSKAFKLTSLSKILKKINESYEFQIKVNFKKENLENK